jgi:hypothetical protein
MPASLEVLIDYRVLSAGPTLELFGYSRHHLQGCFHPSFRLFRPTVPRNLRIEFILSCRLCLFGVPSLYLPARTFVVASTTWVLSLFATLSESSTATRAARAPRPCLVPSSGFLNLSTGYSASDVAGLFHPTAVSRVFPFRGFSRFAALSAHR